ncbi:MAG: hypothetical protein Sw2PiBPW_06000 [Shewanella algae]
MGAKALFAKLSAEIAVKIAAKKGSQALNLFCRQTKKPWFLPWLFAFELRAFDNGINVPGSQ